MANSNTVAAASEDGSRRSSDKAKRPAASRGPAGPGFLARYKPDQGKGTRLGTLLGAGALIAWGFVFLNDRLSLYRGEQWWGLLITPGIAIVCALAVLAFVYWIVYVKRNSSDFMIATEGEMKKVNWSTRREIIGSTKVVITFTVLMAFSLFLFDLVFQQFFSLIHVLKTA